MAPYPWRAQALSTQTRTATRQAPQRPNQHKPTHKKTTLYNEQPKIYQLNCTNMYTKWTIIKMSVVFKSSYKPHKNVSRLS